MESGKDPVTFAEAASRQAAAITSKSAIRMPPSELYNTFEAWYNNQFPELRTSMGNTASTSDHRRRPTYNELHPTSFRKQEYYCRLRPPSLRKQALNYRLRPPSLRKQALNYRLRPPPL
ncbi:uncharacterized protein LOC111056485 [Nilaparvata lugens]|uniref:uncharacterized protein LOC111056485 n=1 Tax=Nilaparvata lugens TaxID=108931 RepID=UPI00193D6030|nr:uncharacterized protein LOC111056485 [Nilaparvata lugens]